MYIWTRNRSMLTFGAVEKYTFTLDEIEHCLSKLVRFAGHSDITVLRHTLDMWFDAKIHGEGPITLLAILLHDAPEAYTGDITSPVQAWLGATAQERLASLHEDILQCICRDIGADSLAILDEGIQKRVKYYDGRALWRESLNLTFPRIDEKWRDLVTALVKEIAG